MKSNLSPISAFILISVLAVPAAFSAPPMEPLRVIVQGEGTVSDQAGFTCSDDCEQFYKKNSTVTLTAKPSPNTNFLGWLEGDCSGTQPTCVLKMDAPKNVKAAFDTAVATYPVAVLKSGQILCWGTEYPDIPCEGTGEDGEYQAGMEQPSPRFVDNGDGTVIDNATGLISLQLTTCLSQLTWSEALNAANNLASGQCNLTDGSAIGDWRLPNAKELQSLSSFEEPQPPPPVGSTFWNQGVFIREFGVPCGVGYWSSTSLPNQQNLAYSLNQRILRFNAKDATTYGCAFAVRGGL